MDEIDFLFDEISAELRRARRKFPAPNLNLAALTEEVGELAQAMLHVREGKGNFQRVREEAVQVVVMAMRCALEGDPTIATPPQEPQP